MFAGTVPVNDGRHPSSSVPSVWARSAATRPAAASGAWTAKIARQSSAWVTMPPSAGPSAAPSVPANVQTPAPRAADPVSAPSTGSAPARRSAAPAPWTQRAAIRKERLPAAAQATDAATKITIPVVSTRVAPVRWTTSTSPSATTATARL